MDQRREGGDGQLEGGRWGNQVYVGQGEDVAGMIRYGQD
jgi:hypothetical protein